MFFLIQRWIIALFAFSADFICYMDRANISATMVPMAEKYKWTKAFQGLVFGVFFLGLMSAHLVGGYLADVYGAKNILIFGTRVVVCFVVVVCLLFVVVIVFLTVCLPMKNIY